jgi:hypothetical protein
MMPAGTKTSPVKAGQDDRETHGDIGNGPFVPRYGVEDFIPMPQTSIGFQAGGNGCHPGAMAGDRDSWSVVSPQAPPRGNDP